MCELLELGGRSEGGLTHLLSTTVGFISSCLYQYESLPSVPGMFYSFGCT